MEKWIISGVNPDLCLEMSGGYYVDSDTLSDFGKIEFSPNNGGTWIDLLNSTTYSNEINLSGNSSENGGIPVLSGSSNRWTQFIIDIQPLGILLNLQSGDTTLWRFSFISDDNNSNRDGLMYDNLKFENSYPVGINGQEKTTKISSYCFPNPAESEITIGLENNPLIDFEISIYNMLGQSMYQSVVKGNHMIDISGFPVGVFNYKIMNQEGKLESRGSFIKQ